MSRTRKLSEEKKLLAELNNHYNNLFDFRIDLITDYLKVIDEYLIKKSEEYEQKIIDWESSDKENHFSGFNYYGEGFLNYNFHFRKLKLESVFLISYGSFESFLKLLTKIFKKYFNFKIDANDFKGQDYIEKSKNYYEKVIELNLNTGGTLWGKIKKYQGIRNRIAHNNSTVGDQNENYKNQISLINGVKIIDNEILLYDKDFILSFWDSACKYISIIIEQIEAKIAPINNDI